MSTVSWASETLVAAAVTTDAWELAREGFSQLLGRGDPDRTRVTRRRLEETRLRLFAAADGDLDLRQVEALEKVRWETRLEDLLDDDPAAEADLEALVQQLMSQVRRESAPPAASEPAYPAYPYPSPDASPPPPPPASPAPAQGLGGDQSGD
jgi:hypothetical protein